MSLNCFILCLLDTFQYSGIEIQRQKACVHVHVYRNIAVIIIVRHIGDVIIIRKEHSRMNMLLTSGKVTDRLLIITVTSLIAVYCTYWATRLDTYSLSAVAIKGMQPVEEDYRATCGFDVFRAVARQRADGYITGSGTWTRNGTHIERFHPSVCRLRHGKWIPEDKLVKCLRQHRVRYIAIIGDSNGRGYLSNLRRLLSRAPTGSQKRRITCGPIFHHDGLNYSSYRSSQVLVKHRCPCGGYCTLEFSEDTRYVHCNVKQVRCRVDRVTDVVLEYITSWFTIDAKVQVYTHILRRDVMLRKSNAIHLTYRL